MSVGHVSRAFESAGIPTVIIMSNVFRGRVLAMQPARAVFTRHIMARPLSAPFDVERQNKVLREALRLLETAKGPGSVVEMEERYRVAPGK